MAKERGGGDLDHEWRSRESYFDSRRKNSPCGDQFRDLKAGNDRVTSRRRELNSAESNNWHRDSSRAEDREPGELSSGSGSEDGDVERPTSKERINGALSPLEKKRKFSPIIWDVDEGKRSHASLPPRSKGRTSDANDVPLPPPPPVLPEGFVPSVPADLGSVVEPLPQVEEDTSPASRLDPHSGDGESSLIAEKDGHSPERNIMTSRWADVDDDDENAGVNKESGGKRQKTTPLINPVGSGLQKKQPSPELGEVSRREGSEGAESRSSGSRGTEDYLGNETDKMEVDEEDTDDDASRSRSDAYSDEEDYRIRTPLRGQPPPRNINMLQGCRSVDEFERLNKINEGTYGVVYRARDKKSGEIVALKKVKMEKEREGFPMTSLREINILLSFHHSSIVDVKEVVVGNSLDSIFMVMEYMEHDLKGLMETMKQPFSQAEVKCLMLQLLEGVKYLHDNWVLHRDLKTSNLLFNNRGELKICDFGLSRQYGSPLKPYTHLVVTLWYRAPELLLGAKEYSTAIDMWSLGCIMAELLAKEPLFNGKTEFDQLDKIFRILGTPNKGIWPGFTSLPGVKVNFVNQRFNKLREKFPPTPFSGRPTLSEKGFDLLNKLLTYDPEKRITAEEALNHEWFTEVPLPKSKDFMPTFPAQNAQDRRQRRVLKSPDPLEEQRLRELQQGDVATGSLFC